MTTTTLADFLAEVEAGRISADRVMCSIVGDLLVGIADGTVSVVDPVSRERVREMASWLIEQSSNYDVPATVVNLARSMS